MSYRSILRKSFELVNNHSFSRFIFEFLNLIKVPYLDIRLDTNYLCNLRCPMCWFSKGNDKHFAQKPITIDNFKLIAKHLFPYARALYLSCGAEPFMSPKFGEYLKIARAYKVPYTSFLTNMQLLTPELAEAIVTSRTSEVIISAEGATENTYRSIRVGGSLIKLIDNINLLNKTKKKFRTNKPLISFNYILMSTTINESVDFIKLVGKHNINAILFKHIRSAEGMLLEPEKNKVFIPPDFVHEIKGIAKQFNINIRISSQITQGKKSFNKNFCLNPWFKLFVLPNGEVNHCYYNEVLGNAINSSWPMIRNSERVTNIKKRLVNDFHKSCYKKCRDSEAELAL